MARRARQASPGTFCCGTLGFAESGGEPPHSILAWACLERDYCGGCTASRIREAGFDAGDEGVGLLHGTWELALGEVFCAAAFAAEFF